MISYGSKSISRYWICFFVHLFFDAPILGPIDKVPAAGIFGYRCANLHNLPGLDASKDLAGSDFFRLHFGNL